MNDYEEKASFKIRHLTALKMARNGNDVTFVYPRNRSGTDRPLIGVHDRFREVPTPGIAPNRMRVGGFGVIDTIHKCLIVLRGKYDVIYVTSGHRPSQFLPSMLGKYLKGAFIVDECWEWLGRGSYADNRKGLFGRIVGLYDRLFELSLRRPYDHIIAISSGLKARFNHPDRITVLLGGAETDSLRNYSVAEARERLGMSQDIFLIGMSNMTELDHPDHESFYRAFDLISKEFKNVFLMITGSDGAYIDKIGKMFHFSDRIIYPGWVSFEEYNSYLSSCNLFVLGYLDSKMNMGRWPNKMGDYLCLERPIISNPTGDVKDCIEDNRVGFLCDGTSDAYYYLLKEVLSGNIDLAQYAKDSLRVARGISFDARVGKILDIFERAQGERITVACR